MWYNIIKDKRKGRAKTKQTVGGQSYILKQQQQQQKQKTKTKTKNNNKNKKQKKVHKRLAFLFLMWYNIIKDKRKGRAKTKQTVGGQSYILKITGNKNRMRQ